MSKLGHAATAVQLGFDDGKSLAIQMLHELEEFNLEEAAESSPCSMDPAERRAGEPQRNVVLRYLDVVKSTGSRGAVEGFASVLTDYISVACEGSVRDAEWYDHVIDSTENA